MPPGDCEILRPFCCPADGAAMGAAAPSLLSFPISRPGAAAPMAARGSLICVRSGFCSQIRDSQRFVTIFNAQLTGF